MNRIDFTLVITAEKCNPNADFTKRPRINYDGYGEISDVCIKRKVRDFLHYSGEKIIVLANDQVDDGNYSIADRVKSDIVLKNHLSKKNINAFFEYVCKKWYDVRAFGQVFASKDMVSGVSVGIRGPVSVSIATSLDIPMIESLDSTKSTNARHMDVGKKDGSTFFQKHIIDRAAYVCHGSIHPQLAQKTGFCEDDARKLKHALIHLFDYDACSARPAGSMSTTLFWMQHNSPTGAVSQIKTRRSLHIEKSDFYPYFTYAPEKIKGVNLGIWQDWDRIL